MPKRKSRSYTTKTKRYRKKARTQPRRAYSGSMVPLRTGGYNFDAPEVKTYDKAASNYQSDDNTSPATSLCTPAQGSGFTQRTGTKVKVSSIYVRGYVSSTIAVTASGVPTANIPAVQCRCTIFIDYQSNGTLPAVTDIYTSASPTSQINLYNRDRFKILMEKTWTFDPIIYDTTNGAGSVVNQIRTVKMFKKVAIPVFYNIGNTGTETDVASNGIVMLWQSNYPNALPGNTVANLYTRCRFVDP